MGGSIASKCRKERRGLKRLHRVQDEAGSNFSEIRILKLSKLLKENRNVGVLADTKLQR